MRLRIQISAVVAAVLVLVISACGGSKKAATTSTSATGTGKVIFVGNGGSTQDAQDQAFLKPFAHKFGVKVDQGSDSSLARAKAAVDSGHPDFDVTSVSQADYLTGLKQGLWAPIDYSDFRAQDIAAMPASVRLPDAVGDIYYSNNFIFNTKLFPKSGQQPSSWADVWNVKKFPGKRGLPGCEQSARTSLAEDALLADGVPADKLYPIDINRALKKIKELAPDVIWYDQSDTALTETASGDESIALGPNGRAQVLIDKGAPLQIGWQGARVTFDVLVILKGAPNMVEAQKLVAFMSQPQPQAKMAELTGYGPSNPDAFKYIDAATKQKMVTRPSIAGETFLKNNEWWLKNTQKWLDACSKVIGA
jgi:putative spermidine/putrescine transport system substrate-binding protein